MRADICIIVEGCYPFIHGGVSTWVDWLIRGHPDLKFAVVAIVSGPETLAIRYQLPDNVICFQTLALNAALKAPILPRLRSLEPARLALTSNLSSLLRGGGFEQFRNIVSAINGPRPVNFFDLMASRLSWSLTTGLYEATMPQASFLHFFWAWRALFGGLFSVLKFQIPAAKVYHSISTGYAGLLSARAAIETRRPALLTEHGIYTNERRVEILMAEWISDTVEKGLSLNDERFDLRDLWMQAFDAYARICYGASRAIVTLYEDNQRLQIALGADPARLVVSANGIDVDRFGAIPRVAKTTSPVVALIGRVVPIKDVKCFIEALSLIKDRIPAIRGFILGPTDEDAEYFSECQDLVGELELEDVVIFTGPVKVVEYLSSINVVVLTSLSEAQPLVLLEAGAAGIPCVATDVGSCREILEGRSDESPRLGRGGYVCDLVSPSQIADATCRLLANFEEQQTFGEALRVRVNRYYRSVDALASYTRLYGTAIAQPDAEQETGT